MSSPSSPFSSKLTLLLLAVASLPAVGVLVGAQSWFREHSVQVAQARLEELGEERAQELTDHLADLGAVLRVASTSPVFQELAGGSEVEGGAAACHQELDQLVAALDGRCEAAFLVDAEGRAICRRPSGEGLDHSALPVTLSSSDWVLIVDEDSTPFLVQPLASEAQAAVVALGLELDPMRLLDQVEAAAGSTLPLEVSLIDRGTGLHVAGLAAGPAQAHGTRSSPGASGQVVAHDGRLSLWQASPRHPLALELHVDRAAVLSQLGGPWRGLRSAVVLLALLCGLAGALAARRLLGPLGGLVAGARKLGRGELGSELPAPGPSSVLGPLQVALESVRRRLIAQDQQLEEAERCSERYELALEGAGEGLLDWDMQTGAVYYSPRFCELLGLVPEGLTGRIETWFEHIEPADRASFELGLRRHLDGDTESFSMEVRLRRADGEPCWALCRARAFRDGEGRATRLAGSMADISEFKRAQEDLRQLAHHDPLTGLVNRKFFSELLGEEMQRDRDGASSGYAVLFFDFDRFKVINDSLGHKAGDQLLQNIARRLEEHIGPGDVAARFGGDEFVVMLGGLQDLEEARSWTEGLLEELSEPHVLHGQEVVSTASVGLVFCDADSTCYTTPEDVIRDADAAMYQAKSAGKAQYRLFDQRLHEEALERLRLEQDLRQALPNGEFRLVFQPIVSLMTGEVAGFEALIRWSHPERGSVAPDQFIPLAEETGQIVEIGDWVVREACRQLRSWRNAAPARPEIFVNVNISRRQLVHPGLVEKLRSIRDEFQLRSGELKLEITETTVVDERTDLLPVMQRLRELGFPLAMDDFGTGYSSLSNLHLFPVDVLKIDRSFISNIEDSREFTAVVQAIMTLARHLDLEVVAEGIETAEQLAQLQVMDCQYAQGFLFARPLEVAEATDCLLKGLESRRSA